MSININYEYEGSSNFVYVKKNISFEELINNLIEEELIELEENEVVNLYDKNNNQINNNEDLNHSINNSVLNCILKVEEKIVKI